jgi:hypothetical protein
MLRTTILVTAALALAACSRSGTATDTTTLSSGTMDAATLSSGTMDAATSRRSALGEGRDGGERIPKSMGALAQIGAGAWTDSGVASNEMRDGGGANSEMRDGGSASGSRTANYSASPTMDAGPGYEPGRSASLVEDGSRPKGNGTLGSGVDDGRGFQH